METKSPKNFWQRPEGKPGIILLAALVGFGGYALYKSLPAILELLKNTYYAVGMGLGLFVIFTLLMDKRFRTLVWYSYKNLMRFLTGIFVQMNPINILLSYVEDLEEKQKTINTNLDDLMAQIKKLKNNIDSKTEEIRQNLAKASKAKSDPVNYSELDVNFYNQEAARLDAFKKKMEKLLVKMEVLFKILQKMEQVSNVMIKNLKSEVRIRKEEREYILKSHSIMKSVTNIIKGNDDKRMLFDQAMEFVIDDTSMKVGEIERMLDASQEFIRNVDLDNAIYEEQGFKMLEEFEKKGIETIFGSNQMKGLPNSNVNTIQFDNKQAQPVKRNDSNNDSGKFGNFLG